MTARVMVDGVVLGELAGVSLAHEHDPWAMEVGADRGELMLRLEVRSSLGQAGTLLTALATEPKGVAEPLYVVTNTDGEEFLPIAIDDLVAANADGEIDADTIRRIVTRLGVDEVATFEPLPGVVWRVRRVS